jgi:hypothetical protein
MNVTETKPLDQPGRTPNSRQRLRPSRMQPAELRTPASCSPVEALNPVEAPKLVKAPNPVEDCSTDLETLAFAIGLDASDDAAIYLHRANTHHDGE